MKILRKGVVVDFETSGVFIGRGPAVGYFMGEE